MLVARHRFVCKRGVLVGLVRGGCCRSGAKVQRPEDPVTKKQRTHEKERELPTHRSAEETQERVLPPTTRHCAPILPRIP